MLYCIIYVYWKLEIKNKFCILGGGGGTVGVMTFHPSWWGKGGSGGGNDVPPLDKTEHRIIYILT